MPAERKAFLIFIYKDFSDVAVADDPRLQLCAGSICSRDGSHQAFCILMFRIVKNLFCGTLLAYGTGVHYYHFITKLSDNTQIMRNHDNCHSKLFLQILHQFQNLGLNGNIKLQSSHAGAYRRNAQTGIVSYVFRAR